MVFVPLPVRALVLRAPDGSELDLSDTCPVELVGRGWDVWVEGGESGGVG